MVSIKQSRLSISTEELENITSYSLRELIEVEKTFLHSIQKHLLTDDIYELRTIERFMKFFDKSFCIYCSIEHENSLLFHSSLNEIDCLINNNVVSLRQAIALSNLSTVFLFNNISKLNRVFIEYISVIRPKLLELVECSFDSIIS